MQALGAAEPLLAQLRISRLQAWGNSENHIVDFDLGAGVLAPQHDNKQHGVPYSRMAGAMDDTCNARASVSGLLAHQVGFTDVPELLVAGAAQQLEQHHFTGDDLRPGITHTLHTGSLA